MTGNDIREGSAKQNHAGTGPEEKELAAVCGRFADLCQYFSQQNMDLPLQVVEEVRLVSKLLGAQVIAGVDGIGFTRADSSS